MKTFLALVAIATIFLPAYALAGDCRQDPYTAKYDTDAGTFYVVDDPCQPVVGDGTCLFSIWIYEETNHEPGLQRECNAFEPCSPDCPSDTDIF